MSLPLPSPSLPGSPRGRPRLHADDWMIYFGAIGCGLLAVVHTIRRGEAWDATTTIGLIMLCGAVLALFLGGRDGKGPLSG